MRVTEWGDGQLAVVRPPSGGFPRHSHDEYVISVNLCGLERVRLDRASFDVGLDEVTVYNPGQVQSSTTEVPPESSYAAVSWYVPPSAVEALTGRAAVDFERPVVRSARLRAELIAAARALGALPSDGRPATAESAAVAQERLTLVLSRLLDLAAGRRPARAPEPADARIAAVLDRLRADLSGTPSLAELAAEAGMSREHLVRTFTRATGTPPYAWHLSARLAEARRRLRGGEAVADVAHRLGFADQAHLHRHFTAAYAITPGRYRRRSQPAR
ncbi:AraC family transcriptional regulator [Allostreptomyces psammosilenae]|uniref:AraC family chemosensory pili system transcriptional regulator ChpD n=1 Tax=Allostreptomyces psammosilenae TaxID=1892865 RepID=A0A852ZMT1_9ACTN|nr:AraC family transcriptional regulator [Allostreptomyces psammosilenae]NYI03709.1 AraC family chemosensory pili system transcriptional regulator ChpD [Allostreptomyces psammosilenae]